MIAKVLKRRDLKGTGSDDFAAAVCYVARKATAVALVNLPGRWQDAPLFMRVTAAGNMRVTRPVYHFVLTWSELEQPTDEQLIAAARRCLRDLDAKDHQAVIAIHRDRAHVHVHVVACRIHPVTFRAFSTWKDYAKLERACRRLEFAQGWSSDRGRFDTALSGEEIDLVPKPRSHWEKREQDRREGRRSSDRSWDLQYERKTGQAPLRHRLPDGWKARVRTVIKRAKTWAILHEVLDRLGLLYARYRSGARLHLRGTEEFMKPSHLGSSCSLPAVEERLGPYEEPGPRLEMPSVPRADAIATGAPAPADAALPESRIFRRLLPSRLYEAVTADAETLYTLHRVDLGASVPRIILRDGTDIRGGGTQIDGAGGASDEHKARLVVRLAVAKKWGSIRLKGSGAFVRRATKGALEAGLKVEGPWAELRDVSGERSARPKRTLREMARETWLRKEAEREEILKQNAELRAASKRNRQVLSERQDDERAVLRSLGRDRVAQALRQRAKRRQAEQRAELRRQQPEIDPAPAMLDLRDLIERVAPDEARRLRHFTSPPPLGDLDHTACRQNWMAAPLAGRPVSEAAAAWNLSPAVFARHPAQVRATAEGGILVAHRDDADNLLGFEHYGRRSDGMRYPAFAAGGHPSAAVFGDPRRATRAVVCGNGFAALSLAGREDRADTIYVSPGDWGPATETRLRHLLRGKSVAFDGEALEARLRAIRPDAVPYLPQQDAADRQHREDAVAQPAAPSEEYPADPPTDATDAPPDPDTDFSPF